MKTKAEIVQRLLEEKKIDAEEAVVLLMADQITYHNFIPQPYPVYPVWPQWRFPFYHSGSPIGVGISTAGTGIL